MKFSLVCKGTPIVEIQEVAAALSDKGHDVRLVSPNVVFDETFTDQFWSEFFDCDLLYYRTGLGDAFRSVLASKARSVETRIINQRVLEEPLMSNKIFQMIQVQPLTVAMPQTMIGRQSFTSIATHLGTPFITKAAVGIQGSRVFLIHNEAEFTTAMGTIAGDTLHQRLVPNTGDYRVLVLGNEVAGIYKRIPAAGEFRANISQGGHGEVVQDRQLENRLSIVALAVADQLRLDITGIDFIEDAETGELHFIEANINPGWKGLQQATGLPISNLVAEWMVSRATS